MGKIQEDLMRRANLYAGRNGLSIEFNPSLGFGEDGHVWKTSKNTAVKVFEREKNYSNELAVYRRLRFHDVTNIHGFAVPRLLNHCDPLLVLEIEIVSRPFILDFGKVYLDCAPEFSEEVCNEMKEQAISWFGEERWEQVEKLIWRLERYGIYYTDARPGNIEF